MLFQRVVQRKLDSTVRAQKSIDSEFDLPLLTVGDHNHSL